MNINASETLHDPARDLGVGEQRVDHPTAIMDDDTGGPFPGGQKFRGAFPGGLFSGGFF
jgi:hypothetical protein